MLSGNGLILGACAFFSSVASMGCNQGQIHMTHQQDTVSIREPADARAIVPLSRTLNAESLERPIEIDFEVLPQSDDPEPPVFVGLRVSTPDPTATAEAVDRLWDAGIGASVHVYRLGGSALEPVALSRSQWAGRSEVRTVAVGSDGQVPGLFATSADAASMREAGLIAPEMDYKEVELVFVRDMPPGRYRAVIALSDSRQALLREKAELLIAYTAKSK